MNALKRVKILLKATKDLLKKQVDSYYVLNLLSETVLYDGAKCDGSYLKEDINYWLDELEQTKANHLQGGEKGREE